MLLGDPGTGKSQSIHHFLLQIAARQPAEAVVV
jgi:predicted NACHT family NTPase